MTRCSRQVPNYGPCELLARHHGPCQCGEAQAHNNVCPDGGTTPVQHGGNYHYRQCAACDEIDAREVLRLASGGGLRPGQKRPSWMHPRCRSPRSAMLSWARRTLGGAA